MVDALRVLVGLVSLLMLLGGLALIVFGGLPGLSGLWLVLLGGAGLIAAVFERIRYRSEDSERSLDSVRGAGAEAGPLEPRFVRTDERFVDPTTRRRLRVWADPATGERRYRPDE